MSFRVTRIVLFSAVFLLLIFPALGNLAAQTASGELNGVVTDPSGGVIAKAVVRLINASGASPVRLAVTVNCCRPQPGAAVWSWRVPPVKVSFNWEPWLRSVNVPPVRAQVEPTVVQFASAS